jgi:multidrug efflux pump subunit AcrA (membrane-fusion protein)
MDENALLRYNGLSQSGQLARNGDGKVPVELQLADEQGFSHQGYVESLDNRLDPQSGSIVLRAVFPNPNGRIMPGLFARIRLPGGAKAPRCSSRKRPSAPTRRRSSCSR